MAETSIEWTDKVWNPTVGCSRISPGCKNCYAFTLHDKRHAASKAGKRVPLQYAKPFTELQLMPDRLKQPLSWQKPCRVFVNSVSDLFHEDVPDDFIDRVFAVMGLAGRHTFQVLTKRAERMAAYVGRLAKSIGLLEAAARSMGYTFKFRGLDEREHSTLPWPLPNVWLGVSVEDQRRADKRIPHLLWTPAAVRFLSVEPLLGPVDLTQIPTGHWAYGHVDVMSGYLCGGEPDELTDFEKDPSGWTRKPAGEWERGEDGVDWVIVGGESGSGARPMHPDWARSLRDQCQAAGVPFFFKQWGEWVPAIAEHGIVGHVMPDNGITASGMRVSWIGGDGKLQHPSGLGMVNPVMAIARVGKKAAGRLLDGREWNEFPEAKAHA